MARVVIVGGGQGGFQAAFALRTEGWDGEITLIGDEPGVPYQRPPLSKAYLLGKQQEHQVALRPAAFYDAHRVERRMDRARGIDVSSRRVQLASGGSVDYDYLILATGARNRLLPVEGAMLDGVCYLRTLEEAAEMRARLEATESVAVIGGGFIGLEVAAAARALGKHATVIEMMPRVLARGVSPVIAEYFHETHVSQGVEILLNAAVASIRPGEVCLEDGRAVHAGLIVVGIGVVPNLELAREAGLQTANGIAVDEHLRTSDENIFAIGDCAEFPSVHAGIRVRLESVQNAVDQAVCVAKTIAGTKLAYRAAPWFWTDQFDIRLQIAGLTPEWDLQAMRGRPADRKFSVFYFSGGKLRAVDSINRPADHHAARRLIATGISVTPEQAADESVDLKSLLRAID